MAHAGVSPNNSFKPNLLRYTNNMADKACHVVGYATQVGLTQALGLMDRRQQLEALAADLRALVEVLARDPGCSWRQHLANCLSIADELLATGFTQDQLSQLSGSTTSIYGGAGSFNDYAPVTRIGATGVLQIIPGMEAVDTLAGNAYQSALTLRVVGEA